MYVNVTIEGVAPILMNRFSGEIEINDTPQDKAEKKAYRNKDTKELEFPCQNIMACLVEAHDNLFSTERLLQSSVQVSGITSSFGTKNFQVDSRSGVDQVTGERIMCHRPRIDEWQLTFQLYIDQKMFSLETAREVIEHAGVMIGLGDYRPGRRGPFGRFIIKDWQKIGQPSQKAA
jgi:hypothetical protein